MPPPPPDVHYKTVVSVRQWRFHCGHSILSWFSGNEELFKERDQRDDEFLDRLKEFKIDSTDPQSEKVRKPNNEGWLTSSDVLFQSIQWPVETSKFGLVPVGNFCQGRGGGVILGAEGKRWRGDCLITNKFAGNLLSRAFQCLVTFSSCFHSALSLALSLSSLCLHIWQSYSC